MGVFGGSDIAIFNVNLATLSNRAAKTTGHNVVKRFLHMHNSYHNKDHGDKIATDRICLFLMRPQPSK